MTAKPDEKCPVYNDEQCWCRRHDCECPIDMRQLTKREMERTLELAAKYGWKSN